MYFTWENHYDGYDNVIIFSISDDTKIRRIFEKSLYSKENIFINEVSTEEEH